jgi:hypothetical protein
MYDESCRGKATGRGEDMQNRMWIEYNILCANLERKHTEHPDHHLAAARGSVEDFDDPEGYQQVERM